MEFQVLREKARKLVSSISYFLSVEQQQQQLDSGRKQFPVFICSRFYFDKMSPADFPTSSFVEILLPPPPPPPLSPLSLPSLHFSPLHEFYNIPNDAKQSPM